jgi:hypothetical protein
MRVAPAFLILAPLKSLHKAYQQNAMPATIETDACGNVFEAMSIISPSNESFYHDTCTLPETIDII